MTIPSGSIPAGEIPAVNVPGASQPATSEAAVTEAAAEVPSAETPGECAQKVAPGEFRPAVFQPATFRPAAFRPALFRPALFRQGVCVQSECIPSVRVPSVRVPSVRVPSVRVPSRRLSSRTLPEITSRCVRVLGDRDATTYNLCADVLFAFDRAKIRPGAAAALRQVARSIDKRYPDRRIKIDGHTDSRGADAYNDGLSLRRAEAVKRWLVEKGGISESRIAVRGYGEAEPLGSNATGKGRQRNRRVVVGVARR